MRTTTWPSRPVPPEREHFASRPAPQHARPRSGGRSGGRSSVEGNERLTAGIAVIVFILLFVEGLTILSVRSLLHWHVFIGLILIPPVLAKIASTSWRFARYYAGNPGYRRRGPPPTLLRLLGPVLVVLTVALFATGVALVVGAPVSLRPALLQWHRLVFVAWFAVAAIHVLGHLGDTLTLAPRDWVRRTRRQVRGASARQWVLALSLAVGLLAALWVTPYAAGWRF
ncbi:MAG TPA: hypothetical protein VFN59_03200 [Acidimicrobiales bacterium]|nr:hypothetical protein [Acidimicrobiales bacterium]